MGRQRGFILVELLAVMAIAGVLAGVVSGSVSELGDSGRFAQIQSDTKTLEMAADWFFNDSSFQSYLVKNPDSNGDGILDAMDFPPLPAGDVNVRVIDFAARLPQKPTESFVPDFIKQIPDSAAVISYRVNKATGDVFAAIGGAALMPRSNRRSDVTVADNRTGGTPDLTFNFSMSKNRAAVEVLNIQIPPGYSIGGQSLPADVQVGKLDVYFDVDNPWKSGHVLKVSAPILTTGRAHEWEVSPDYSTATSQATGDAVDTVKGAIRPGGITRDSGPKLTHTLDVVPASEVTPGVMTLEMDLSQGAQLPHHESRETRVLQLFGRPGGNMGNDALITNPAKAAVYRWTGEAHSTIQLEDAFELVAGNQKVVIKDGRDIPSSAAANDPLVVNITSQSGGTFMVGESLFFVGSAVDAGDGDLAGELVWTSNLDGVVGAGGSFSTTALTEGYHTVTASVSDSGSLSGFDTVSVIMQAVTGEPNLAFLIQPSDTVAGGPFSPTVQVEIRDGDARRLTEAANTILVAVQDDPNKSGSILSGTEPVGGGIYKLWPTGVSLRSGT